MGQTTENFPISNSPPLHCLMVIAFRRSVIHF